MDLFGEEPEEIKEKAVEVDLSEEPEDTGFAHPCQTPICLGHDKVEQQLLGFTSAGRVPHGLIFAGPRGIGKATMGYRFARHLFKVGAVNPDQDSMFDDAPVQAVSMDMEPDDPVFRLVSSGGHPDLLRIERAYDSVKNKVKDAVDVEQIRKVTPFLRMTASEGGWRVVVIDDADTMNRNAQNALLKILEEPPKDTVLVLIAHRAGALIPTIRSRARVISFNPLSDEALSDLLSKQGYSVAGDDLQTLLALSKGSFGRAIELVEQGGVEALVQILNALQDYPSWNRVELYKLADELGGRGCKQSYKAFSELLGWVFSELALAKARGQGIQTQVLNQPALEGLLKHSSLEQLLKICENLDDHFKRVDAANLDKRQAVFGAFTKIAA